MPPELAYGLNVVSLCRFRRSRPLPALANSEAGPAAATPHPIFYLNETGGCLPLLSEFTFVEVHDIRSKEVLRDKMLGCNPELVLLESSVRWCNAIEMIRNLDYLLEVPIVMVCDKVGSGKHSTLVKQAFAAGIHDTLIAPLLKDDLAETLEVLLKYQKTTSLQP